MSADTRDAGMTVVETSVAMVIAAVLLVAVTGVYIGTVRTVRTVNVSTASVADARLAMEAVSRTLRVAYQPAGAAAAITAASPTSVSFWALLNRGTGPSLTEPTPTLVTYSYNGTCLMEAQTIGGTSRDVCVVRTTTPPAFSYYTSSALSSAGASVAPLPASPSVAATDLPTIQSVEVSLTVHDPSSPGADAVPVVNRVTLANVVAASS